MSTATLSSLFVYLYGKQQGRKRKMNRVLWLAVAFMAFCIMACDDSKDAPAAQPVTTMSLTVNGESYVIDLTRTDTVNLRTLTVEFPTQFKIENPSLFTKLTIGGKEVQDGECSLQIDTISSRHQIEICFMLEGMQHKILLNTLHKSIPGIKTSGTATSPGDFYLSYVYIPLIEKVDNKGRLLFYRCEPLKGLGSGSSGLWDFKKHRAADGKIYYSYHEPDDNYASWRFNGFNPGKRIIMDASYHRIKEIQLEASKGIKKGFPADGHDFYMFTPDHYILMSYIDRDTIINDCDTVLKSAYFQEVQDGDVKFDWWSIGHGELAEMTDPCFATTAGKDYVHMNSIDVLPDGNLLCSFRHISSVLAVDRKGKTGKILWCLKGADNDGSYSFHGQHSVRYHEKDNTITLFNNGNGTGHTQMLRLHVDINTGKVTESNILLDDGYYSQACGALSFSGDNMIAGWGIPGDSIDNGRVLTEYDASGNPVFSISRTSNSSMNSVLSTYRSVKCE